MRVITLIGKSPIKVTGWVETTNEAATFLTTSLGFVAMAPGLAEDGDIDGGAKFGALREHSWIKLSSLSQINRPIWLGTGDRSDAPGSTLPIGADTANGHECVDS